jgi:hypothetical protein
MYNEQVGQLTSTVFRLTVVPKEHDAPVDKVNAACNLPAIMKTVFILGVAHCQRLACASLRRQ